MHGTFYNEAFLEMSLEPVTPLLIKAGGEGWAALDPTIPEMNFVRTRRADGELQVYIPGSSLRGVVRGYAERLLRSVRMDLACDPTRTRGGGGEIPAACFAGQDTTRWDGPTAYQRLLLRLPSLREHGAGRAGAGERLPHPGGTATGAALRRGH